MQATRESVAYQEYDLRVPMRQTRPARQNRSAARRGTAGKTAQTTKPKAAPAAQGEKKRKSSKRSAQRALVLRLLTPGRLVALCLVAVLSVAIIYSQMELTQKTAEISEKETELARLESEYVSLKSQHEQKYNAEYITSYAEEELGMVKMNNSQIEYIEIANPDQMQVNADAAAIGGAVGGLVRGLNAFLEYLR